MAQLSYDDLLAHADAYDAAVDASPLPDAFCSSFSWIVPAFEAFSDRDSAFIHRFDEGWAPWMRTQTVLGRTLMPMEASWGLAAPFVGADRAAVATRTVEAVLAVRDTWDAMFLSGLERGGADFSRLVHLLSRRWRLGLGQTTARCVASLEGGHDGFLARRTPVFRKNLRRARKRAQGVITFEFHAPRTPAAGLALLATILDVERTSWKGREGHGIDQGAMQAFYGRMVPLLADRSTLRVTLARLDGKPVGYVLGGVHGRTYRGLQISFDEALSSLEVGNLLQDWTIQALCDEGVGAYDLGTDMPYKRRWAEVLVETVPLVVR